MKVILLKSVPKVGNKHDVVNVAEGYAMNALFPRKLAEAATEKALARVKDLKSKEEADRAVQEELLIKNLKAVSDISIEIKGKANDKGHLFAGLHKEEIAAALKEQARFEVSPEYVILEKPVKEVGEHKIEIKVQDKSAEFTLVVTATE